MLYEMASKFQQELPPPGGYAAYNWGRKAARRTNGLVNHTGAKLGHKPPYNDLTSHNYIEAKGQGHCDLGYLLFSAFVGFTTLAWVNHHFYMKKKRKVDLEMRESRIAVQPLFWAEAHRDFLKQLRRNRDEENDLMKDVPGWVTGTLYGKKVMYNERERFMWPDFEEYYMHSNPKDQYDRICERLKH